MQRETLMELMGRLEREHGTAPSEEMLARSRSEMRQRREAHPREPVWRELEHVLGRLCARLAQHADKEHRYVFPYLRALAERERGASEPTGGAWGSVDRMADAMRAEHEALLDELGRMGALGSRCPRGLRDRLGAIDTALRARIRFEEKRLYPAAMEVEAR